MTLLWDELYSEEETPTESQVTILENVTDVDQAVSETLAAKKAGPVVIRRKREGLQLCKVYDTAKPPKWDSVFFEPKFDGYRCIALVQDGKAELLTSTGLPHYNVDFIKAQLEAAATAEPERCDNVMLDGEILHETMAFDPAGGLLRASTSPDPEKAKGFVFHVWDTMKASEFLEKSCPTPLNERKTTLGLLMVALERYGDRIVEVDYKTGPISQIEVFAREFVVEDGMEGIVAKNAAGTYQFRKSSVWLKWKPKFEPDGTKEMKEGDFRITGMKPGRGKHQGRLGAILIEGYLLDDGNIAPDPPEDDDKSVKLSGKAGTGFNDAQREQFQQWHDEGTLVGRCVECRYQELSSKGKVRFPVFYRLREDKDE